MLGLVPMVSSGSHASKATSAVEIAAGTKLNKHHDLGPSRKMEVQKLRTNDIWSKQSEYALGGSTLRERGAPRHWNLHAWAKEKLLVKHAIR